MGACLIAQMLRSSKDVAGFRVQVPPAAPFCKPVPSVPSISGIQTWDARAGSGKSFHRECHINLVSFLGHQHNCTEFHGAAHMTWG